MNECQMLGNETYRTMIRFVGFFYSSLQVVAINSHDFLGQLLIYEKKNNKYISVLSLIYFCSSSRNLFKISSHKFLFISMKFFNRLYVNVIIFVFQCVLDI